MTNLLYVKTDVVPEHLEKTVHFKLMLPTELRMEIYKKLKEMYPETAAKNYVITLEASVEASLYLTKLENKDKNEQYNGIG